jgi:hypothetical protein
MAVVALPAIPPIVAAIGEAVLWIAGAIGVGVVTSKAVDAIDSALEDEEGSATETCKSQCATPACPPCVPPAGTIMVERIDRVPPGKAHFPCTGDHAHLVQMNQVPYPACRCFWNKASPDIECLSQGGNSSYQMK